MDVTERGLPLEEAFRQSLTDAERTEHDKYEAYRDPVLVWIVGEPPTQYDVLHDKYHQLRQPWQERFIQMLRTGELSATALEVPTTLNSRRTAVPAHLWDILELDFDKSEASGAGLKLIAIEVSVATQPQQSEPPGDLNSDHFPLDLSVGKGRLHLSEDNRILTYNSEEMYFRGSVQQSVLRQLFDAYPMRKHLRTQEVLGEATTSSHVDTIGKVFSGSRHWKTLKHIIKQEDGYCWFEI